MEKIDTLLLVDDDKVFQFLTQKVIETTKLVDKIKIFSNGFEAIAFLSTYSEKPELLPEIILLDLNMPIMDGWEFLEEYVRIKPKIAKQIIIYIITSSIDPADIKKAEEISEVSDYIIKPITKDKFINLLKNL